MKASIFIGPMSLNIVDSVIDYCNDNNVIIGLIPSRRQVDSDSGYVNNWTTETFCRYVRSKTNNVLIVRDHGGPLQGELIDDGIKSLEVDIKKNNMDILHIDIWKKYTDLNDGIKKTIEYINHCYTLNPNIYFEVGTEQSIRNFTESDLDDLLSSLKNGLDDKVFRNIKYVVIQSGTALQGNQNIGHYDKERLVSMISIVRKYNLLTKEHNGDYLPVDLIKKKFILGLDSINIAPEFGQIETNLILSKIGDNKDLFEEFYRICYESNKWVKWVPENFIPYENKEEIIKISGHYVFSNTDFLELKKSINISDDEIKDSIRKKIHSFNE